MAVFALRATADHRNKRAIPPSITIAQAGAQLAKAIKFGAAALLERHDHKQTGPKLCAASSCIRISVHSGDAPVFTVIEDGFAARAGSRTMHIGKG